MYDKICECCGKKFRGYVQDKICLDCMYKKYVQIPTENSKKKKDADNND